jgi:hypothetical protein
MSPTKRSLKKWRDAGYLVAVVEKWNPYCKVRNDLFGCFDLLGICGDVTVGIQTTTMGNVNARCEKLRSNPNLALWCQGNRKALVEGWAKRGPRGKAKRWTCKEVWL